MADDVIVSAEDFEGMVIASTLVRTLTEHEPRYMGLFMAVAEAIPNELLEQNADILRKGTV